MEKIGKSDLIGNENIFFLFHGENILAEPNVLIKEKFKSEDDNNNDYTIVMVDNNKEPIKF